MAALDTPDAAQKGRAPGVGAMEAVGDETKCVISREMGGGGIRRGGGRLPSMVDPYADGEVVPCIHESFICFFFWCEYGYNVPYDSDVRYTFIMCSYICKGVAAHVCPRDKTRRVYQINHAILRN